MDTSVSGRQTGFVRQLVQSMRGGIGRGTSSTNLGDLQNHGEQSNTTRESFRLTSLFGRRASSAQSLVPVTNHISSGSLQRNNAQAKAGGDGHGEETKLDMGVDATDVRSSSFASSKMTTDAEADSPLHASSHSPTWLQPVQTNGVSQPSQPSPTGQQSPQSSTPKPIQATGALTTASPLHSSNIDGATSRTEEGAPTPANTVVEAAAESSYTAPPDNDETESPVSSLVGNLVPSMSVEAIELTSSSSRQTSGASTNPRTSNSNSIKL
jgi:hypothetical protein